jgi:hypothetical protein
MNRSLREAFTGLGKDVQFYSESLHLPVRVRTRWSITDHFQRKYAKTRPDLIVAVMSRLWTSCCGTEGSSLESRGLCGWIGPISRARRSGRRHRRRGEARFRADAQIALRLQPDTRTVFVVSASGYDRYLQAIARRDFALFERRVSITYLTGLPMSDLLPRLSRLPPNSVVQYLTLFADGAGRAFIPHEALSQVAGTANVPVYVSLDQYVGRGVVGGHVYSVDKHGRHAAEIGVRILR